LGGSFFSKTHQIIFSLTEQNWLLIAASKWTIYCGFSPAQPFPPETASNRHTSLGRFRKRAGGIRIHVRVAQKQREMGQFCPTFRTHTNMNFELLGMHYFTAV
jgi:hypothetical protein